MTIKPIARLLTTSVTGFIAAIGAAVFIATAHRALGGINVWTGQGPPGAVVRALAIDPNTPSTLYAGTGHFYDYGEQTGDVHKSTDAGATWSAANAGLREAVVSALAIDPSASGTVYAGTLRGDVFKSTDAGATWVDTGLSGTRVPALAIDPTTPSVLYAATYYGVYKSTDGASTWGAANVGLPATQGSVSALAVDPTGSDILYAGISFAEKVSDVFKSTDGGSSWSATNSFTASVMALAIDPTRQDTVYAGTAYYGVLNSTDGGGTWGGGNYGQFMETRIFALAIDPKTPRTLYAAGDSVFKSTDAGATWRTLSAGLTNGNAHALAIAPTTPGTLYAGTDDGVFSIQPVHCTGDCNGDGGVAVSEMVTGVNIALGSVPVNACSSFDAGDDARVTIDDLIVAVNNALKGCATEGTE